MTVRAHTGVDSVLNPSDDVKKMLGCRREYMQAGGSIEIGNSSIPASA